MKQLNTTKENKGNLLGVRQRCSSKNIVKNEKNTKQNINTRKKGVWSKLHYVSLFPGIRY